MSEMFQATLCKHKIEIEIDGEWQMLKHLTDFNPEFGGNIETWNPMEALGASVSEKTSVENKITASCYRTYGATVNDTVAKCVQGILDDVKFKTRWTLPDATQFTFVGVYNVTKVTSGTTKDLDKMEFEIYPYGLMEEGANTASYTE